MKFHLYYAYVLLGLALETAKAIKNAPDDGTVILGDEIGVSRIFKTDVGKPWSSVGIVNDGVNNVMIGFLNGDIINFTGDIIKKIPMSKIGNIFTVGPTHDLIGHMEGKDDRGAFAFSEIRNENDAHGKYRSLWITDGANKNTLISYPTHKGNVCKPERKNKIWKTRSNLFLSRGVGWQSSKLVATMTKYDTLGGRSWTSLKHDNEIIKKVFALWANSIYGMITYWANGNRSQPGRSTIQVGGLHNMQCPDFEKFDTVKLAKAASVFDNLKKEILLHAGKDGKDNIRRQINDAISELFGLDDFDTEQIVKIWCVEPSICSKSNN